jgi:translation elongation factor EF-G
LPTTSELAEAELAIFIVSAVDGIVRADIDLWQQARELYIPSLVIVSETENSDLDFDDMAAIAGKMLDPVVTPYLVLYSDESEPAALINLQPIELGQILIHDYSSGGAKPDLRAADTEHLELVVEFHEEYHEALAAAGEDAFGAGLLFPTLPWVAGSYLGRQEIMEFIELLPATL